MQSQEQDKGHSYQSLRDHMWKWIVCLFLISLTSWLPGQVDSASQLITIPLAARSVQEIVTEISQQSGYDFSYNSNTIDQDQVISFGVEQATLEETLTEFSELIDVQFVFIDQQIVLRQKQLVTSERINNPKYFSVSGIIRDASTGESLIGATISIGGTARGTVTNAFGYYALQLPAEIKNYLIHTLDINIRNWPYDWIKMQKKIFHWPLNRSNCPTSSLPCLFKM